MTVARMIVLVVAATGWLGLARPAHALTTLSADKCLASQIKTIGKGTAAELGCYAKAASKGLATDGTCLSTAASKMGAALDKLDAKLTCLVEGTSATRASDVATFASTTDGNVGHAAGKCDAAKSKLVGKYVAAITGCYAKAAGKTGAVDPTCVSKAQAKLGAGVAKAEAGSDCSNTAQATFLLNQASVFADAQACALDPSNPGCLTCGNGVSDPGEACDASAPPASWNQCGADFACFSCNCACPSTIAFATDETAPETVLDVGWTGLSHRLPVVGGGDVTLHVSCAASGRPCGSCAVSGPIRNLQAGTGELDSGRCSTNSARRCMIDAECTSRMCLGGANDGMPCAVDSACPSGTCPAAGTCAFYFGSTLSISTGAVPVCVINQFAGPVSGTVDIESGEAATTAVVTSRIHAGIQIDAPCPKCANDVTENDGATDGTCSGGARAGLPCDANGTVPGRPDFGATSLDCPPIPNALLANLPIDLSNATGPVVKTLTAASPNCTGTGSTSEKCLCDTCNNLTNDPCASNADCPMSGGNPGVCGGKRCLGGSNAGAPCTATSECPGGGLCGRPGQPTRPSECLDDTSSPNRALECADPDSDGEGECTEGPLDQVCSLASGHGQRGCNVDADCGGSPGSCGIVNRHCFLTGGGTFQPLGMTDGTDTLVAVGMEDPPVGDQSNPTLGAAFCVGVTGATTVNVVSGLPGPGRLIAKGHAVGHP